MMKKIVIALSAAALLAWPFSVAFSQTQTATSKPATAANQTSQITQETTTATGVGAPADSAYAGSGSASIIAVLKGIYNAIAGAVPAGTNLIGKVGIDQTTPGTTNAVGIQANQSGTVAGVVACDSHVFKHITSATDTLAVQGVTSKSIYICAWRSRAAGTATWYLENTASTNANCSSTLTQLTGVASEVANTGETWGSSFWSGLKNTSGNGLCINSTGTGGVDIDIWYTQL